MALQLRTLFAIDSTKKIPEKWQVMVKTLSTEKWEWEMRERKSAKVNLI
jgi:hypothetical protein